MEFLVAMATAVPDEHGAARAHEFARHKRLLRLWSTPARPGESRTLGLFSAADRDEFEQLLAGMSRAARVTPLGAHDNDPAAAGVVGRPGKGPEFLIGMTLTVPPGIPASVVDDARAREAGQTRDLAARGHLLRLWTLPVSPDGPGTLGLWRARDLGELEAILESLPLSGWVTIETTPLSPHPQDPIRLL
ncbi:muconolactone Delta-isomerase family protein [Mycobacterium asiaticum]|uniref:muconolactone Delta-isomerase family protein n=1 Tax=Mycobacterium asiaticum TaxID=1790 RepID=UPI0007EF16D2|nr:muconolactone Delta-isomerase family protein [Mycobacterium asiaticum]OBJ62462.1 muconolactone delta-isomerase [Mycobacterium asiaticum]